MIWKFKMKWATHRMISKKNNSKFPQYFPTFDNKACLYKLFWFSSKLMKIWNSKLIFGEKMWWLQTCPYCRTSHFYNTPKSSTRKTRQSELRIKIGKSRNSFLRKRIPSIFKLIKSSWSKLKNKQDSVWLVQKFMKTFGEEFLKKTSNRKRLLRILRSWFPASIISSLPPYKTGRALRFISCLFKVLIKIISK